LLRISFSTIALFISVLLIHTAGAADPASSKAAAVHAGQEVFTANCMQCHAIQPDQVRLGPSLYGEMKPPHAKKTDAQVREILKNGKGKMPSFEGKLTPTDINNLLAYLHTF
jgi:mono/diheme cytochrome c family protein